MFKIIARSLVWDRLDFNFNGLPINQYFSTLCIKRQNNPFSVQNVKINAGCSKITRHCSINLQVPWTSDRARFSKHSSYLSKGRTSKHTHTHVCVVLAQNDASFKYVNGVVLAQDDASFKYVLNGVILGQDDVLTENKRNFKQNSLEKIPLFVPGSAPYFRHIF